MKQFFIFNLSIIFLSFSSLALCEEKQGVRVSLGSAEGTFSYTDSSALSGDFDHDLSGGAFSVSYIKTNENNLFYGGGLSSYSVSGPRTGSKDAVSSSWTYYDSTYGYFDAYLTVNSYSTSFLFGLIGYDVEISDKASFQPNLRLGSKSVNAQWTVEIEWRSWLNQSYTFDESTSGLGLEIDLPFMYNINESFGLGANLCICGSSAEFYTGGSTYKFTSSNVFNILTDFYF